MHNLSLVAYLLSIYPLEYKYETHASRSNTGTTAPPVRSSNSNKKKIKTVFSNRRIAKEVKETLSPVEMAKKKMAEKRKKRLSAAAEEIMSNRAT